MTIERRRSALGLVAVLVLVLAAAGCAPKEPAAESEAAPAAEAEAAAAEAEDHATMGAADTATGAPRIFFVEPAPGATVTSPVHIVFGTENFIIEPRVEGEIHHGAGHHHIGLDTQCVPPGEIIPSAAPWVHFGDGSTEIDFQLPPGEHHLVAQIGDGEHRTLDEPGLCAELHVTVVEGGSAPAEGENPTE
jgi:hypothetical protein